MGTIHIDADIIRGAAQELRDKDTSHDDNERPSEAVYEAAVARWLENAAHSIAQEPAYYAYGANRILSYDDWEDALDWAKHQAAQKA